MLGEALAKILRSQLGQYLDTEDLEVQVAFNKPIKLTNVKLKESAFREANLPIRYNMISLAWSWQYLFHGF